MDAPMPDVPVPQDVDQSSFQATKDTIAMLMFGSVFVVLLVTAILWPVFKDRSELGSESQPDQKESESIVEEVTSESQVPENIIYVHEYANYGELLELPIGPWINLEKNIVPSLKSNVVVLMYMVHYQGFSKNHMSYLQDIYENNMHKDTVVIGVQQEYFGKHEQNRSSVVKASMAAEGAYFPTVIDVNERQEQYTKNFNIVAFPTILVIDKFGNVRYEHDLKNRDKLIHAIETMQNENTPSPPSGEELVLRKEPEIKEASGLDSPSSIRMRSMRRIKESPFYLVGVRVYNEGIDPDGIAQYPEDNEDVAIVIGADINGEWHVGVPFDENYCAMLQQVEFTHEEQKLYELIRCQ